MRGTNMLKLQDKTFSSLCCFVIALGMVSGAKDVPAAPPGAQALQGTSSTGLRQNFIGCPLNAGDFGPVPAGKVQTICDYNKGVNLLNFCSSCLCSIYSVASQSLGSKIIPVYNTTAAEVYGLFFGPNPQSFYDNGMRQCDPLVTAALTAAGAFPPSSWKGVDICMSLSASQELLDISRSSAPCDLSSGVQLEVAKAQSSSSSVRSAWASLTVAVVAAFMLLVQM